MQKSWLLGFVSLLLLCLPSFAFQAEQGPDPVPCPTCDGARILQGDCPLCQGEGDHNCANCVGFRFRPIKRHQGLWVPQARGEVIQEHLRDLNKGLKLPTLRLPGSKKKGKAPRATKLSKGEIRCLARCTGGKLLHVESWVDCKVCTRGKHSCEFCKKGKAKCTECKGKRKVQSGCDDCAGVGTLPDPRELDFAQCPWCLDTEERACGSCDQDGKVSLPCKKCFGHKVIPCDTCKGTSKGPCGTCGGRGRHGAQKVKCEDCAEQGFHDCFECDGGALACTACEDSPKSRCPHCRGKKVHPCNGCMAGAYGAWELAGTGAASRGDLERARGWWTEARSRCEDRYDLYLAQLRGERPTQPLALPLHEEMVKAVKAERRGELKRLDRLLKSIK